MTQPRDYYDVLGVSKSSTPDEIKSAYRKLCMKWHPDRHSENKEEATEKFKEIGEAYQVLSDEKQKKIYDQFGHEGLKSGGGGGFQQSNVDPNDLFRQMFGGDFSFSSFGNGGGSPMDDDDFGSFFGGRSRGGGFSRMFQQGGMGQESGFSGFSGSQKRKAEEITHTVNVSLEDLYTQKVKKVKFSKNIVNQNGTSRKEEKVLEFPMRAGVKQDSKIRFTNEGDQYPGQIPADIVFKVNILPHERFKLEKQNLVMYKNITLAQALRSNLMVKVDTLDGRELKIPITDIVNPKYEKIVQNEGMPSPKGGRGDLVIRFNIQFPTSLSKDQKEEISKIL
eukprot:gene12082-5575_t